MNAIRVQHIKFTGPLALAVVALPFSIAICNLAVGLLGISWIVEWNWKEKWKMLKSNPTVYCFILFFLLHIIATIYSIEKKIAWFSVEKKILFLVFPVILATIKLEKADIRFIFNLFIISCLTATLICLSVAYQKTIQGVANNNFDPYSALAFQTLSPQYNKDAWGFFSYVELASGINMHPTYLSLYITFCVMILIHFHAESFSDYSKLKQAIILATLLYLSIFIICLSSRIITLAFFGVSIYGVARFLIKTSSFTKWSTVILVSCLLIGVLYLNPVTRFRNYQEVISTWPYIKPGLQTQSTTIRVSLWSSSVQSLRKINYFIGTGTGDVERLVQKTSDQNGISNILNTHDPHNQYLYTLLGLGIIGLIALLLCFVLPAIVAIQKQNYFHFIFIVLFALLCLTESAFEVQKGIAFFCLFSSLFLFQSNWVEIYHIKPVKA